MKTLLSGGTILTKEGLQRLDISIEDNRIFAIGRDFNSDTFDRVIPCDNFFITPGFVDVHVHLREPGFSYKETIATGTAAAAKGDTLRCAPCPMWFRLRWTCHPCRNS